MTECCENWVPTINCSSLLWDANYAILDMLCVIKKNVWRKQSNKDVSKETGQEIHKELDQWHLGGKKLYTGWLDQLPVPRLRQNRQHIQWRMVHLAYNHQQWWRTRKEDLSRVLSPTNPVIIHPFICYLGRLYNVHIVCNTSSLHTQKCLLFRHLKHTATPPRLLSVLLVLFLFKWLILCGHL